jgi:benzoylformate decarboxylase
VIEVRARGADAAVATLAAAGVTVVFGNPGTTELPLMKAIGDESRMRYVLALHEDICTGMAAGYAAASGKLGTVLLHALPGVAHGLCNYYNAFRNGLPVLLLSGQQDLRHQYLAPMLYGDLQQLAAPFSKFSWETRTPEETGPVLRRAIAEALTAPTGPAFVSLPLDVQLAECEPPEATPPARVLLGAAPRSEIRRAAALFVAASAPAIVAGDTIGRNRAEDELARVAEETGSAAYWEPLSMHANFPKTDAALRSVFFPSGADFRRAFEEHDFVLWCGADLRAPLIFDGTEWNARKVDVVVLSDTPAGVENGFEASVVLIGDPKQTLAQLREEIAALASEAERAAARARRAAAVASSNESRAKLTASATKRATQMPASAMSVIAALLGALPDDAIVIDDAVSNSGWVALLGQYRHAADYMGPSKGGGIGLGLPAALGAQLACPERPVVAFLGDGAALYSIQGLWTAARYELPVVFIILNNASYRILKGGLATLLGKTSDPASLARVPGLDLDAPETDFVACARSFGVEATHVDTVSASVDALRTALASRKPYLIDIAIERDVRPVLK